MKKCIYIISSLLCLMAAGSCSTKELVPERQNEGPLVQITITAGLDEASKAYISEEGKKWTWSAGDELAVFDGTAKRLFTIDPASAGSQTARFTGEVSASFTSLDAVFPYAAAGVSATDFKIPADQTISAGSSVDPLALIATGSGKKYGEDYYFSFKSAVSLLRFITPAGVSKVILQARGEGEKIAGESAALTVSVPSEGGTFWAAVNPASYNGLRVFTRGTADKMLGTDAVVDLSAAGKARNLGNISGGTEVALIEDSDEFAAYFAGGASTPAFLCADIDLAGKTIPACEDFTAEFDGQGHRISNWTSSGTALFDKNSGTVKDFTLDSSCSFSLPATLSAGDYAFVVKTNQGKVSGIRNEADVAEWTGEITGAINLGIIVGNGPANSIVENCYNSGKLVINAAEHDGVGTSAIAAVIGRLTNATSGATDCINEGSVTVNTGMSDSGANVYMAGIVGCSTSAVPTTRCINKADIKLHVTKSSSAIIVAGVNSYTSGAVTDCGNEGDVSVESDGYVQAVAIGGIVAYSSDAMKGTTPDGIYNTGDISLKALYDNARNSIGSIDGTNTTTSGAIGVGGIAGYTYSKDFYLDNAKNTGAVSVAFSKQENKLNPAAASRFTIGGLVGDGAGPISNSANEGAVSAEIRATSGSFTATTAGFITYIGGIVGSNYVSKTQSELNITNCSNSGPVSLHSDNTHTGNCAAGGIVGWPGKESGCTSVTSGCENTGDITVSGNLTVRAGGIQGGSGRIQNCTNRGKVWAKSGKACIGGIAGFHSGGYQLAGCKNFGDVQCDVASTTGIGGLAGCIGNSAHNTGAGCAVNCSVTSEASTEIGMLVGHFNGKTAVITLGSESDPIKVKGSLNGTAVDAGNFGSLICGPANYSTDVHTINAAFGE